MIPAATFPFQVSSFKFQVEGANRVMGWGDLKPETWNLKLIQTADRFHVFSFKFQVGETGVRQGRGILKPETWNLKLALSPSRFPAFPPSRGRKEE